jgi:hypothetical protein
MRALLFLALAAAPMMVRAEESSWRLVPLARGGFAVEGGPADRQRPGLASAAELVPLLMGQPNAERVDYGNGVKLDGVYTITVGREDGAVRKYKGATDIIIFADPATLAQTEGVTTLEGGVVFALKIDNQRSVQRFERGIIALTQTKKSL